jgi:arabinose-5-phosphate isomerase
MLDDARSILLTQAAVLRAVASSLDASLPSTVDKILSCRGHIIVCGAGTSHTVAIRFAHLLSSCGTPAFCLDALDSLHGASGAITGNDILYIITNRAQTPEVITLASVARRHGASIIVQTGNGGNARSSVESRYFLRSTGHSRNGSAGWLAPEDVIFRIDLSRSEDPLNLIAIGTSLLQCAACDMLCRLLLKARKCNDETIRGTHPAGGR